MQQRELNELIAAKDEDPPALVVAVCTRAQEPSVLGLAGWAQAAGTPLVTVALEATGAQLGPLSLPGRPGCAHCAQLRIRAAAAFSGPSAAGEALPEERELVRWVERVLDEELELACSAPLSSPLLDHVLALDGTKASEPTRHCVVPLPDCPVCGGARALAEQGEDDADPLAGWVDPLTGVIPALQVDQAEGSGLPAVVTAAPPHVIEEDGSLRAMPAGWGKGLTLADALRSAVGETIERYSASLPDPARLVWARPGNLDGEHLDPRGFPLYRADQYERPDFPYVAFDPDARHPWVLGRWLSGGEGEVWIHALFAFLAMTVGPENLICQGSSNGLAASTDWDDAALRAVLELVERDAMMTSWLTGEPAVRIGPDSSLEPAFRTIVEQIEALGAAVELYLLPSSVCGATALCLALGDGAEWPGADVALAADLDPAAAVRKSLLELGQTGPYLRELLISERVDPPERETDVRTMLDHATYYFLRARAGAFGFLRAAGDAVSFQALAAWEGERSLDACASALERVGIRVALVDVTAADVATGPFRVVRAVSPDLQPISHGYGCDRVPVERIRARADTADAPAIHPIW